MFELLENGLCVHLYELNDEHKYVIRVYDDKEIYDSKWDVVGKNLEVYSAASLFFPDDKFLFDSITEAIDVANKFKKPKLTFGQLIVGDTFNTLAGRWVKIDGSRAIHVINGKVFKLGEIIEFQPDASIVPLYVGVR